MKTDFPNDTMIKAGLDEDGCGIDASQVVRAVQVWSVLHPKITQTVAEASAAFNVSPEFLARIIRAEENPFFFLSDMFGDKSPDAELTLEHDGM